MGRSVERAAENEDAFRRANESLEAKAGEEETCTEVVRLTREEYESVRAHPKRFVMMPAHQEPGDRVIRKEAGFTVIEKSGEEGELVAQQDPRSLSE